MRKNVNLERYEKNILLGIEKTAEAKNTHAINTALVMECFNKILFSEKLDRCHFALPTYL